MPQDCCREHDGFNPQTCSAGNTLGQDLNLSLDRVLASRNFTNKLWNAGKFIAFNLAEAWSLPHAESIVPVCFDTPSKNRIWPLGQLPSSPPHLTFLLSSGFCGPLAGIYPVTLRMRKSITGFSGFKASL